MNVPTIIQWEDVPLLEVGKFVTAGYTTKFTIFNKDGEPMAVVKGSQIYPTKQGTKAGVTMRYPQGMTVCELAGRTLFELRRTGAAALQGQAELYTPEGAIVKASADELSLLRGGTYIQAGNIRMTGTTFEGHRIGFHFKKDGLSVGIGPGTMHTAKMQIGGTDSDWEKFLNAKPDDLWPGAPPTGIA